jgi:hypothetical protein
MLAPPLDAFRSRMRFDEKYKAEMEAKFRDQPETLEDLKLFQTVI